jgi:hypothetical protein
MGRIDAQVLDRDSLSIADLSKNDFVLRSYEHNIPVRSLRYEDLPVDVLMLLDVSGSMRVQVERVANASQRALSVLAPHDRVAVMVFTTGTSVRLKFSEPDEKVAKKLDDIANGNFGGGTDIHGALMEAAEYVGREARREARRAIVIVTDDQARAVNRERVAAALSEADTVVMALLAPLVLEASGGPVGGPPRGPWPGGGGTWGGPVIFGSPFPFPGSTTGPMDVPRAGTEDVARESGGESMPVGNAASLETVFRRIRQRYAIYYHLPEGVVPAELGALELDLADRTRQRHPYAELRYRQVHLAGETRRTFVKRVPPRPPAVDATAPELDSPAPLVGRTRPVSEPRGSRVAITPTEPPPPEVTSGPAPETAAQTTPKRRRRPAVSEPGGPKVSSVPSPEGSSRPPH